MTTALHRSPVLTLRNLSAGYDGLDVVHDVSLHVEPGEVVALLGANGAGKTTTLLTVSGLVAPTSGSVEVLGERSSARRRRQLGAVWRRARAGVAHVPADRGLFRELTVAENLRLGRPARARVGDVVPHDRLVEWFPPLAHLLDRPAGLLSGGEQQMLAIARALVGRPRLLLIDELSTGLAPLVVAQLLGVLRSIADETGAGLLVVEQHVHLLLEVADRGYLLRQGRVALAGTAGELAAQRDRIEVGYLGG